MECSNYIYSITNTLSAKVYIGQTFDPDKRWIQHKYYARKRQVQYIHHAMAKHGIDGFKFEVIACCRNQEDLDATEAILIEQYKSRSNEHGYNIGPGGETPWNKGLKTGPLSDEQKQQMRDRYQALPEEEKAHNAAKLTAEREKLWSDPNHVAKMSNNMKDRMNEPEAKANRSKQWSGKCNPRYGSNQPVHCGESSPSSKLTVSQVLEIRAMAGKISHEKIALLFGVTRKCVSKVINRQTWKHA